MLLGAVRSIRKFGVRYAAEFNGKVRELGLQTAAEGTALGLFFAVIWRISHTREKARYDKYYANLRAQVAAGEE